MRFDENNILYLGNSINKLNHENINNIYLISDTHFGHENMYKYEPLRKDVLIESGKRNIDELVIHRWNEVISSEDIVFHLGDFSMNASPKDFLKKLNGHKVLLQGNHDKGSESFHLRQGWDDVLKGIHLSLKSSDEESKLSQIILNEIPKNRLAHSLVKCFIIDFEEHRILFSHFPVFDDNPFDKKFKHITSVLEELYILLDCTVNIHGHTHSKNAKEPFCRNVCVEHDSFRPVKISELC